MPPSQPFALAAVPAACLHGTTKTFKAQQHHEFAHEEHTQALLFAADDFILLPIISDMALEP